MLDAACGVGILSTAPRATRAPSFPIPPVAAFPDLRCQSCPTLSLSRSEVQALCTASLLSSLLLSSLLLSLSLSSSSFLV